MTIYTQRRTLFEKADWEWEALPGGLRVCDHQGSENMIPWREIRAVRVAYAPTRFKTWRHLLELTLADRSRLTIDNVHFRGVGNFENRSETYIPFVLAVVEQLKVENPQVPVRAGAATLGYWGAATFVTLVFAILAMLLLIMPIAGLLVWVKLGIIAFFLPALAAWFVKARPRAVSLHTIPADSLPRALAPVPPADSRSRSPA